MRHWAANNARDGETDLLLYSDDGRFMQVIEGASDILRAMFAKIQADSRHRDLLKLADGPIAERHFGAWLMGFTVLSTDAFAQLAGYVEPESAAFQRALTAPDALVRHLLKTFVSASTEDSTTGPSY